MMYKIDHGKLIVPPTVWKGMIGYNNNLEKLVADGWKPKVTTGEGDEVEFIEHNDYIEERHSVPPYDYRAARAKAFPSVGDMIDAICKAYDGDDTELKTLMAQRNVVKAQIKKIEQ